MRAGVVRVGLGCWALALGGCGPSIGEEPVREAGSAGSTAAGSVGTMRGDAAERGETGISTTRSTGGPADGDTMPLDPDVPADMGEPCHLFASSGCGVPSPRSAVLGVTPLGPFDLSLAVFGSNVGCFGICGVGSNIRNVVLHSDPELTPRLGAGSFDDETVVIGFPGDSAFEGPTRREVLGVAVANRDGVSEFADAWITFEAIPTEEELAVPFDEAAAVEIAGTVRVDEPGWDLEGTFTAVYCPRLNTGVICE